METNEVTEAVIGAALTVHRALGPGLLESTYEHCLAAELEARGIGFERQHALPLEYRAVRVEHAYRVDFVVEEKVVVEVKSVTGLETIHVAQVLTYLKLSGCTVGLLLNFNVALLKEGIRRVVLNHPEPLRARGIGVRPSP